MQHALIFCLKAIGILVDKAIDTEEISIDNLPIYWKNFHFLRNNLIHHCPTLEMPDKALELLTQLSTKVGQLYYYFKKVIDARNTQVNLKGEKYKVFFDVNELALELKKIYSREKREELTQQYYIKTIINAIAEIEKIAANNDFTHENISALIHENPSKYYALQNLLELISTLANPNEEYSLLTEATRANINNLNTNTDDWLRLLGKSRISAMHRAICIDDENLVAHLQDMLDLKKEMLMNKSFRDTFNILLSSEEKSEVKTISSQANQNKSVSNQNPGLFGQPQTMAQKLAASLIKSSTKPISSTTSNSMTSSTTQATIDNKGIGKGKKK